MLPTFDSIIEGIVEDLEDDAPINQSLFLYENVIGAGDGSVDDDDVEEEEDEMDAEATSQLVAAQELLYSDWSTRDALLT